VSSGLVLILSKDVRLLETIFNNFLQNSAWGFDPLLLCCTVMVGITHLQKRMGNCASFNKHWGAE